MPIIKRAFFISCREEECLKLADLIKDNISTLEALIDVKDYGIEIVLYGYKTDVRRAWEKIKQIVSFYKELTQATRSKVKRIPVSHIVSLTKKTFPPTLLAEILARKGYRSRYASGVIETDADLEVLKSIVEKISEVYERIKYSVRGTTTKYFITASSILLDLDPDYVIDECLKTGLLKVSGEEDKPKLAKEWRQALDDFIKYIRERSSSRSSSVSP